MKEQKLIEMRNKLDKLDQIMQQVIQEMYNLKNLSVGTLETIKRMSEYDQALEKLKAEKLTPRHTFTHDPIQAANQADAINTDVWVSMGDETQAKERKEALADFQVNEALVAQANKDFLFLHILSLSS